MGVNGLIKFIKYRFPEIIVPAPNFEVFGGRRIFIDCAILLQRSIHAATTAILRRRRSDYKKGNNNTYIDVHAIRNEICNHAIKPLLRMNQQLREVRTGGGVDATFVLGSSLTVKDLYIASRNTSDDVAINVLDCKNPQLRDSLRLFFENSSVRLYAAPSERDMLQFAQRLSDAFACVEVRQPNIVRRCVEFCDRETDCVLSDDTNAIALGAPNVIRDYCGKNVSTTINHIALLNAMGFSRDQFVDFCVLCGTDGIPLIPHIGPERAYRIVSSFNSLEAFIHSEMLDKFLRVPNVHKTLQKRNINLGEFKNSLMDVKSLRNTLIDINV